MKRKKKAAVHRPHFFLSTAFLIVLIVIALGSAAAVLRQTLKKREVNAEIIALQKDIEKQEKKKFELIEMVKYFQSESYADQEARLNLGLKKKGENVLMITGQDISNLLDSGATNGDASDESYAKHWLVYFFPQLSAWPTFISDSLIRADKVIQ